MTELPLLESDLVQIETRRAGLIPERRPAYGEQYRFHFDMGKCIGCKCCVVACNEQNGNPAAIQWRRVGEVEGGYFPNTKRHYLSMGCNHCVDPSCLRGCPVEAYTKQADTGVVVHSADTCIGCQYCVWNCSYGVPQFDEARGVVGKCDLCHHRLADGMAPACANACPEQAIGIEIVDIAAWARREGGPQAPGMPEERDSISTTRITMPAGAPPDLGRVDRLRHELEQPHWPLVVMLVLTQMSIGAFVVIWLADLTGGGAGTPDAAWLALAVAVLSLSASVLHLGRPIYAFRALRNLRRSWLSREVLGLGLFAGVATGYALALALDWPVRHWMGAATVVCGLTGMYCSARLYLVPARPMWNTHFTWVEFGATALWLGPLMVAAITGARTEGLRNCAAAGAAVQMAVAAGRYVWMQQAEAFELRASAAALGGVLRNEFLWRLTLCAVAGIWLPLATESRGLSGLAFALSLGGEVLGRWLFFVSVTPRSMAAGFSEGHGGQR